MNNSKYILEAQYTLHVDGSRVYIHEAAPATPVAVLTALLAMSAKVAPVPEPEDEEEEELELSSAEAAVKTVLSEESVWFADEEPLPPPLLMLLVVEVVVPVAITEAWWPCTACACALPSSKLSGCIGIPATVPVRVRMRARTLAWRDKKFMQEYRRRRKR